MKKFLIEAFGWYGVLAMLGAYALLNFGMLPYTSIWYQLLNFTAALGIIVVSVYKQAYQPAALNFAWLAIAAIGIYNLTVATW